MKHLKYRSKGKKGTMGDADIRGYAAIKEALARAEKRKAAELAEWERRGGNGRPYQKHWVSRGTTTN